MSRHRTTRDDPDWSPLERFIREEDSRRELARLRRRVEELVRSTLEREAAARVSAARFASPWRALCRAVAWARQMMTAPRTGTPPS